jgi:hypothetical protein
MKLLKATYFIDLINEHGNMRSITNLKRKQIMQITKQEAIDYINQQKTVNIAYIKTGFEVGVDKDFLKEVVENDFLSENDICDKNISPDFYDEIAEIRANALQDCLNLIA